MVRAVVVRNDVGNEINKDLDIHTDRASMFNIFSLTRGLKKKCYALLTVAAATKKHGIPKNKTTTNLKPKPVFLRRKLNMLEF